MREHWMFEKEIKFIRDFSLNKVKNLGSHITFRRLESVNLHPAILNYISSELEYMIYSDRKRLLKDSLFDYTGKEITENFKKIANEIKESKKISFEDIKKLITQAVSFNANYIVRPKWSLTKLIYNDMETVGVDELELNLNYIYYYEYIKNVLTAYISKRQLDQFSITDFDLILNKIDREIFKQNSEELINNALITMGDFFNIGGIDNNVVPLNGMEIFLKEKNLIDYLLKLHRAIPEDTKKKYEIDDIKNILYTTTPVTGAEAKEKAEEDRTVEIDERDEVNIAAVDTVSTLQPVSELSDKDKDITEAVTESEEDSEDVLPIEKEFEDHFEPEITKISDPLVQSETTEPVEELIIEDEPKSLPESEVNETYEDEDITEVDVSGSDQIVTQEKDEIIPEETAEVVDSSSSSSDELIDFYEKELAMIDDKLSDRTIPDEESYPKDDDSDIQITEETLVVPINNEVKDDKDTIDEEKFNLSIFDEGEKKEVEETASEEKVNEADGIVRTADEIKEIIEEKTESITEGETEQETPAEKEIVQQMIDDHDKNEGDEFNKEDQEQEYFDIIDEESSTDQEATITKEFSDETEFLSSFGKTDSQDADSDLMEETSEEDDISVVKDEFEKLLEEDEVKESTIKAETEQDQSNGKDSNEQEQIIEGEFKFEETITTDEDNEAKFTRVEIPVREKDLLSYLSKKEIKKIISNVFAGDDEDFVTSIEKISECGSYNEATEILKGTFFSYRISPYSKEAVVLTNATSNYFRQV
jgi:hypothetical protein